MWFNKSVCIAFAMAMLTAALPISHELAQPQPIQRRIPYSIVPVNGGAAAATTGEPTKTEATTVVMTESPKVSVTTLVSMKTISAAYSIVDVNQAPVSSAALASSTLPASSSCSTSTIALNPSAPPSLTQAASSTL